MEPTVVAATVPTVDAVRARLEAVLAQLRAAAEPPWSDKEAARWKLIVPQMADWLPPEEGESVRAEFAALIQRLDIVA